MTHQHTHPETRWHRQSTDPDTPAFSDGLVASSEEVGADVVFVGIDGPADSAVAAALWGADDARRRGGALRLVRVDTFVPTAYGGGVIWPPMTDQASKAWHSAMDGLVLTVTAAFPGLNVGVVVGVGAPVEVLDGAGRYGALTVVGSVGNHHEFVDVALGSIAAGVVARGRGPVVVVRTDPSTGVVRSTGPIVVGLDGSVDSDDALAFAFEEADLRDRVVYAVLCCGCCDTAGVQRVDTDPDRRSWCDAGARRALDQQLAGWATRYPDVVITPQVLHGPAAAALLGFCTFDGHVQPELLVVGGCGRGGFTDRVLGSTHRTLITHAPCPVAVVHKHLARRSTGGG